MKRWFVGSASLLTAVALVAAGCGSSKKSTSSTESTSSGAKGGTLMTVANAAPSGSPDPQVNYTLQEWQLLILTHDGLVGFKRAGGTEGTKIVPDLAHVDPEADRTAARPGRSRCARGSSSRTARRSRAPT